MKKILFFFIVVMMLAFCKDPGIKEPGTGALAKMEMMNTDREFSNMSREKGMRSAFIEYLDSNGVLLRPNRLPIAGADAVDYLIQQNDTDYTLTWEPRNGYIAKSGELGYTYGIYSLRPSKKDTVIYGTYVSIWKKDKDGNWKYVLDSGNEGISDAKNEQ
jgi:ketosteroid isomerase-like protein